MDFGSAVDTLKNGVAMLKLRGYAGLADTFVQTVFIMPLAGTLHLLIFKLYVLKCGKIRSILRRSKQVVDINLSRLGLSHLLANPVDHILIFGCFFGKNFFPHLDKTV